LSLLQRPVLVSESVFTTRESRMRYTEMMFDRCALIL
jgi:hypothetical protein